ncbi:UPF0489 family protein [Sutcliffiella horikoshii]|uniref:UPF0489 family protein n=1 Tax=Sutcliffiella horikoshii TaxID=79883 RepID=UPI001CBAB5C4|nr:UPF0489 family protein [Sutcliffiella horikoshii]UAL46797.1 UPF0489 family protein [Sutcliffiella horikoshii]
MIKVKDMPNTWKIKYPKRKIYLMRDHNWAFSAWEISRLNGEILPGARLLHVDFHDDYWDPEETIEINTEQDAILAGKKLNIAEFIKAAESTGTIKDVYMIGDYSMATQKKVVHSYSYYQFENEHRLNFFQPENQSFILDLDLDFFNIHAHNSISAYNSNPYLYSDEYIKKHLERFKQYVDCWDIITVCISPEHCGGNEAAQHLLDLFLEVFELTNEPFIKW